MKIGFDGKRAANNLTGLGNYSRSLIEQLATRYPANDYLVYTPKVKNHKQVSSFLTAFNITLKKPSSKKLLWRSVGIVKDLLKDDVEIFHGLSHEIPFGIHKSGIRSVVTMHDLIFLRFPAYYKFIDRFLYRLKSRYACKHADRIIAISEKTKADIVEFYGTDPNKIEVIYQTCDDSFKTPFATEELARIRQHYQLPEKFLLSVGTIEDRKNLLLLIRALKDVDKDFKLVVIGKQTPYFESVQQEIEKLELQQRVIFLKNIPFSDLPGIYQLASIFVYPSFYEGFGIPIIEALYSKIPVIAATGSCLEEAGGPDSLYVNPNNAEELTHAIQMVINQPELQQQMKERGMEFVQKFESAVVTKQLMDCYIQVHQQSIN